MHLKLLGWKILKNCAYIDDNLLGKLNYLLKTHFIAPNQNRVGIKPKMLEIQNKNIYIIINTV